MEILEIKNLEDKNLHLFFKLAKEVYKDDQVWNIEDENQIKQRLHFTTNENDLQTWAFVVLGENGPIARAVSFIHPKAKDKKGNKIGWIGYFEALRNQSKAVNKIFDACEETFRKNGVKEIFATKLDNLYQGLQISNFHLPQTIMTNYNPQYYFNYFRNFGYKIHRRITSLIFTRDSYKARYYHAEGFNIRNFNRKNLEYEIKTYHNLTNAIFSGRFDYIERNLVESERLVHSLLPIIDEELIIIAEDKKGNPIGYLICLPDFYQLKKDGKIDRARMISIGVIPNYRRKKVAASMGSFLMKKLLAKNYQMLEGSIIMKSNIPPQKLAKKFGAKSGREFVLLRKKL